MLPYKKTNDNLPDKIEESINEAQINAPLKFKGVDNSLEFDEERSFPSQDFPELSKIVTGVNDEDLAKVLVLSTALGSRYLNICNEYVSNAATAAIMEMRPQNATEALLISQMVAVHFHAINALMKASETNNLIKLEKLTNLAVKLNRTYLAQLEALNKYRRGGHQKVTVEHVHVNEGGQAIVGNVAEGGRGEIEN
jgi:hypothetical protein